MKKLFIITGIFALILSLLFCERTITYFEFETKPAKIVINSILNPDSIYMVHLSRSMRVSQDERSPGKINNPVIELSDEDEKITEFVSIDGWSFSAGVFAPEEGKDYTLQVSADGFNPVRAQATIPLKPMGIDVKYEITDRPEFGCQDCGNLTYLEFEIQVTDPPHSQNYYWIEIQNHIITDSVSRWVPVNTHTDSHYASIFRSDGEYNTVIPDDDAESGDAYILTGDQISTDKFSLILYAQAYDIAFAKDASLKVRAVVAKISKPYYDYIRSLSLYKVVGKEWFSEPTSVSMNVENGFGILGASSGISKLIDLSDYVEAYLNSE